MRKRWDEFEIGQMLPLVSMALDMVTVGKRRHHVFSNIFDRLRFILAGNDDIHKSLNEFETRRDRTIDYGVGCPSASEKFPLIMEKMTSHFLCYFSSDPFHTCRQ